jgi:hypothetical protein
MGKFIGFGAVVGFSMLVAACGGSSNTPKADDDDEDRVCEPGVRRCDGLNVKACDADGTAEIIEETCLPGKSCSDGVCTETSCVPNTKFCKGASVYKCDTTGGGSALSATCPTGQFCVEDDGDAECSDTACTAGDALCAGSVATTCAADGSGPKAGGTDCAETNQACYEGECRDQACTAGMKVCQHDDVYLCAANGTEMSLLAECGLNEACDGDLGACRPKLPGCEPGKAGCDGSRIVECNAYGTAWIQAGEDCAADNEICLAGSCKKQTCTPSSTFCQDGDVYQCDSNGIKSERWMDCSPENSRCQQYPSSNYATCEYFECTPGEVRCVDNVIKTCDENRNWPDSGTACDSDEYCEDATSTCKPQVCEPFEYFCDGGDVYYCTDFGGLYAGQQPEQKCPSDTACKKVENGVTCVALPCSPGSTACVGNKVGTCATDGSGLAQVTTDCTTTASSICNTQAQCAKTVEDTVGVAESAEVDYPGELMGNVFEVTAGRKLVEIEMSFVLAAPRELRWVIYEQTGSYFVARIDKLVANQSGTGFISSGAMSYTLKAGKRYLIGVAITGGDSVSYYDTAPWAPSVSFGSTLGYTHSVYQSQIGADYLYSDRLYQMRLTTEAP